MSPTVFQSKRSFTSRLFQTNDSNTKHDIRTRVFKLNNRIRFPKRIFYHSVVLRKPSLIVTAYRYRANEYVCKQVHTRPADMIK